MAQGPVAADQMNNRHGSICPMIEEAAQDNGLPVEFFARLIWQESRFKPDEIGPMTRSGQRAQGIAQFMPGTAVEQGLYEPFNPIEALPKSGQFLAELRGEFGNLGLAAAAYNAGPQRVRDFLGGVRSLPAETRHYVRAVTGRSVEDWKSTKEVPAASGQEPVGGRKVTCLNLVASLQRESGISIRVWQGRSVPSWCKGLSHPNRSVCGPVRLTAQAIKSPRESRSHVHLVNAATH